MSTEEHLSKIVAKCRELLAIAEKRTPGKWDNKSDWPSVMDKNSSVVASFVKRTLKNKSKPTPNAIFIANCAGPAEAGWRATIAAIARTRRVISLMSGWTDNEAASRAIDEAKIEQSEIIAAWPEELLT